MQSLRTTDLAILIICHRRPLLTRRVLDGVIQANKNLAYPLYVVQDGIKPGSIYERQHFEVRTLLEQYSHYTELCDFKSTQLGLFKNVTTSIDYVSKRHDFVVVLEDDILISKDFLHFCTKQIYNLSDTVFQISGLSISIKEAQCDHVVLDCPTSWGWCMSSQAWEKFRHFNLTDAFLRNENFSAKLFDCDNTYPFSYILLKQLFLNDKSWAIALRYYAYHFGLKTIYSTINLCENLGFDGSGENCRGRKTNYSSQACLPAIKTDPFKRYLLSLHPSRVHYWVKYFLVLCLLPSAKFYVRLRRLLSRHNRDRSS